MSDIKTRLSSVRSRIRQAEEKYQRPAGAVSLLAVSKTWPAEAVLTAMDAGQHRFGENYIQEAVEKITTIAQYPERNAVEWHFIGAIQSNKTKEIARHFQWVHSLDRLKIARRLNDQRPASLPPLNVCLQVNISAERTKSGATINATVELARQVAQLPRLTLRGLMAIPAPSHEFNEQRAIFHQVNALQQQLNAEGLNLDTLSMGMSGDLEAAIAEGATVVRVGSAIFGPRHRATTSD